MFEEDIFDMVMESTKTDENSVVEESANTLQTDTNTENICMFPESAKPYTEDGFDKSSVIYNLENAYVFGEITEAAFHEITSELNKYYEAVGNEGVETMLPQTGSTDGAGDPGDSEDDLKKEESEEIEDEDEIEMQETVIDFINDIDLPYNEYVESAIEKSLLPIFKSTKTSRKLDKLISKKVALQEKLKAAKNQKVDKIKIIDLKRQIVQTTMDIRQLKKSMKEEMKNSVEKKERKIQRAFSKAKDKNVRKAVQESVFDDDTLLESVDEYLITEEKSMEPEIKPIVEKLNKKGYHVKYSSPGHENLRKKEDKNKDGEFYGRLYSDARIMFDDDYAFPKAPEYWRWKKVDGKDYLDIIPKSTDDVKGNEKSEFTKWKKAYMNSLRDWVDNLPEKNSSNDSDEIVTKESVDELYSNFMKELEMNFELDQL